MSPIDLIIRALGILFGLGILVLSFIFGAFILMTIVGFLILAVIGFYVRGFFMKKEKNKDSDETIIDAEYTILNDRETMIDRIDEYKSRRKKRKLRRIAFALLFTGFAVLLSWFFESQVTTTVIITTHAELETDLNANSGLSDQGLKRANSLASTLSSVDVVSGVDAIYATTYRATQETLNQYPDSWTCL
ncbi:MAG: hypothetical protein Ct9H90mP13_07570 [Pseudomonadota bacterium]|nr:MAG: hypothetical protein Ct9H90mP13_07570 [Pseudomonadota bacterium]